MPDIQLIKTPSPNTGMPQQGWQPTLGLLWLATYLKQKGIESEILDGEIMSKEEILSKLESPYVGLSFDIMSTDSFDEIVKKAKEIGATTIVGGQAATPLAKLLLKQNLGIDYVVRYDGEYALESILRGENPKHIPNLTYRVGRNSIISNPDIELDLTQLPIPDRDLIPLEDYIKNFQKLKVKEGLPFSYDRPTSMFIAKGCPVRREGKGCSWCARIDKTHRRKTPQQFIDEINYLMDRYGIDHITEWSDDFLSNKADSWLEEVDRIGTPSNLKLRILSSIRYMSEKNIKHLRNIGVETILLGIEGGNDKVLRLNHKYQTREQVIEACRSLGNNGIKVSPAYILGLVGETWDSLEDTRSLSEQVNTVCETEITYWNPLTPLPGSPAWNLLIKIPEFKNRFGNTYRFDTEELVKANLRFNTQLGSDSFERVLEFREKRLKDANIQSREYVGKIPKTI